VTVCLHCLLVSADVELFVYAVPFGSRETGSDSTVDVCQLHFKDLTLPVSLSLALVAWLLEGCQDCVNGGVIAILRVGVFSEWSVSNDLSNNCKQCSRQRL